MRSALFQGRVWTCVLVATSGHLVASGWTPLRLSGGSIHALAVDPAAPGAVFAGTNGGGVLDAVDPKTLYAAVWSRPCIAAATAAGPGLAPATRRRIPA